MVEFFKSLPKHTLAMIVIGAGIFLIVVSDPPATVCGEQVKAFNKKNEGFLTKTSEQSFRSETRFQQLIDVCKRANTVGGCYELFQQIRGTADQIRSFSIECLPRAGAEPTLRNYLDRSLDLLIRLAWGVKPPETINLKLGWLEPTEVALFCRLKDYHIAIYGQQSWNRYIEKYLAELPGASAVGRTQAWGLSLMSIDCARY